MSTVVEASKLLGETLTIKFDVDSRLEVGETLATAVCGVEVFSGTDASPSSMLSGTASISGAVVSQKITGGTSGVVYTLTCAVRTSLNNILLNQAKIAVLPSEVLDPDA